MSQIKEIITTLLNTHERGSLAYLEKYIHMISGRKVSQEQSKQYAEMLCDYNDYLDDRGAMKAYTHLCLIVLIQMILQQV